MVEAGANEVSEELLVDALILPTLKLKDCCHARRDSEADWQGKDRYS